MVFFKIPTKNIQRNSIIYIGFVKNKGIGDLPIRFRNTGAIEAIVVLPISIQGATWQELAE